MILKLFCIKYSSQFKLKSCSPDVFSFPRIYPAVAHHHDGGPVPHVKLVALPDHAAPEHVHVAVVEVIPVRVQVAGVAAVKASVTNLSGELTVHSFEDISFFCIKTSKTLTLNLNQGLRWF